MKKYFKIILCMSFLFIMFSEEVNAAYCSESVIQNMSCDTKVKNPTTGIIGSVECSGLKPTKVYYKKYGGGSRAYFACYYSSSDDAYFYIQYDEGVSSCKAKDSLFVKKGSDRVSSGSITVKSPNACAEYLYVDEVLTSSEYGSYNSTQFHLTAQKDEELEKEDITDTNPTIDLDPDIEIAGGSMTCSELLGPNLTKIVKLFMTGVRVVGIIIAIVMGMVNFIPAIIGNDPQSELKKAFSKSVNLVIALIVLAAFPIIIKVIGTLLDFDLSCFV